MKKKLLKNTPFGYSSADELFEKLVVIKFNKLKLSEDINDYYDFIFSAGALREWIIFENNMDLDTKRRLFYKDKYFSIFQSIYNNSKHFKLEMDEKHINYFIEFDGKLSKGKIIDGILQYGYDTTYTFDDYYTDSYIAGDYGELYLICIVADKNGNKEHIFLYEICKRVIESFQRILSEYCSN